MGLLMFSLSYILAYRAQIYITSALSAIVFSSMLWMNIINSRIFFGVRAGPRIYAGGLLGNMASQAAQTLNLPVVQSNAWSMLYGGLLTALIALLQGLPFSFDPSPEYVLSLAYLTLFGSVIAFGAYLTLLGRIGAHRAGYATVMFPVVALILSILFEDLALDAYMILGIGLVLSGNLLVLAAGKERKKS